MRVGAVIVTWNRADQLALTLDRTLAEPFDVVWVVDNASEDHTDQVLEAATSPRLRVIRLPQNIGGAGGFHAGVAAALAAADCPDWLALFDDDAWPEAGFIQALKAAKVDATVGVLSAAVRYPDGKICEMNRQGQNPFWHVGAFLSALRPGQKGRAGFKVTDHQLAPTSAPIAIDNASFVGFVLRTATARAVGLPDPDIFIYGDDVLYSLRLRRAGWRILLSPSLRFLHDCGTMGEGFVYRPLWKVYYHCRNGISIARMAAGPLIYPLALAYYVMIWWRRGHKCPAEQRPTYFRLMRLGIWDGLTGRTGRSDLAHDIAALAPPSRER